MPERSSLDPTPQSYTRASRLGSRKYPACVALQPRARECPLWGIQRFWDVSFHRLRTCRPLLDDLVGAGEQRGGYGKARSACVSRPRPPSRAEIKHDGPASRRSHLAHLAAMLVVGRA
jgi:hypothetical protein